MSTRNFDGNVWHGHTPWVDPAERPPLPNIASPLGPARSPPHQCAGAEIETPPSFELVYSEGFPFVFRVLRSLGVHSDRLEDAAQDVFTVVHRRLPEFEARSSVRTWLFGIAARVASTHRRSERRDASRAGSLPEELEHEGISPHAHVEGQQAANFVDGFVKSLDEQKRAVFALSFMEEMPAAEVAQALGIPLNTAYSRIRTVRELFKKAFERRKRR